MTTCKRRFWPGKLVTTAGVADEMNDDTNVCAEDFAKFVIQSLRRHLAGDWGDMSEADKAENEYALGKHLRLFSAYEDKALPKIWIITEADRSVTTVLFPDEY